MKPFMSHGQCLATRLLARNLDRAVAAVAKLIELGATVVDVDCSGRRPVIWLHAPIPEDLERSAGLRTRYRSPHGAETVRAAPVLECQAQWRETRPMVSRGTVVFLEPRL